MASGTTTLSDSFPNPPPTPDTSQEGPHLRLRRLLIASSAAMVLCVGLIFGMVALTSYQADQVSTLGIGISQSRITSQRVELLAWRLVQMQDASLRQVLIGDLERESEAWATGLEAALADPSIREHLSRNDAQSMKALSAAAMERTRALTTFVSTSNPLQSAQADDLANQIRLACSEYVTQCESLLGFLRQARLGTQHTATWVARIGTLALGGFVVLVAVFMDRRAVRVVRNQWDELRASAQASQRLALIAQRTTNAVIVCDRDRRITWVNAGFTRLYGYSPEEAIGRTTADLLEGPETEGDIVAQKRAALARGEGYRVELTHYTKDREPRRMSIEGCALLDQGGQAADFVMIVTDVTEARKQAEQIAIANDRLQAAVEGTSEGLWDLKVGTEEVWHSKQYWVLLGLPPDAEPPSNTLQSSAGRIHPDDSPRVFAALNSHITSGTRYDVEFRLLTFHGDYRWFRARGVCQHRDGKPTRMAGLIQDVHERKEMEAALRDSETLRATIIDVMPQRLFWKDKNGRFLGANRAFLNDAGVKEVVGKTDHEMPWRGAQAEAFLECDRRVMQTGQPEFDIVEAQKRPNGSVRWLSTSKVPLRGSGGDTIGVLGIYSDITEVKLAEEELRRAKEMAEGASQSKSEFLANMSHEIRTPMTAILGFVDVLDESTDAADAPEERHRHIATIKRHGSHLLSVIDDILDISKIEAGKLEVETVPTDVIQVLEDVLSIMRVRSEAKGIALRVRYETAIPRHILSDPIRLRQILLNLVGNAVKFTELGEVSISFGLDQSDSRAPLLRVTVQDTGIGMSDEQLPRLFEAFEQADSSMKRRFGGTGLGLRISKRLAQSLGGDITASSILGTGSTFILTVATGPLEGVAKFPGHSAWARREKRSAPSEVCAPSLGSASSKGFGRCVEGVRVLLAEDGPDNQRLIAFYLKKEGAQVTIVANGLLALQSMCQDADESKDLVQIPSFDIVLMDMQMPEMDGYAATSRLRSKGCKIPIIALTAHAMSGDRERCMLAGCSDYATKPIERAQFFRTMCRSLGRPFGTEQSGNGDEGVMGS